MYVRRYWYMFSFVIIVVVIVVTMSIIITALDVIFVCVGFRTSVLIIPVPMFRVRTPNGFGRGMQHVWMVCKNPYHLVSLPPGPRLGS